MNSMKKLYCSLLVQLFLTASFAQGYHISVQSNYKKGIAYLTYYRGRDLAVQDSAAVSSTGRTLFTGTQKLPAGIYAIVFPGKQKEMDFLVEKEQTITITADTSDLSKAIVKGSPANDVFKQYQAFVSVKGAQLQKEKAAYSASATRADSLTHEAAYARYSKELNDYRENIIKTKPASMMATLLNAMRDPQVPKKVPVTHADSLANYNFFKDHYWDGITFMDDRIIRTPFFLPKLETYYRTVMSQSSDSLIRDIDYKLLLARNSPEMFKYLLNWFTDEYFRPKYMGQDAVFVYLFNQYHSKGMSPWLDAKQQKSIADRAYMQMANLVGEQAANLEFLNTADKVTPLYDVQADYTVVLFWDPSCGHCKEELPKIDSIYRASWKAKNVKIYAVLSENNKPLWLDYIKDHHIEDWINVYQTKEMADADSKSTRPGYKQLYDVIQTPTLYLLDKDKRIVGKKLTWDQLDGLLEAKRTNKN
jgi:thiol-disulfide isomerase/thioredoxin